MDFSALASLDAVRGSLASIVARNDNVAHNPVPEGQSSGAEGSNSTEEQKSGTEVQKFYWKRDERESEWIRKLELGLDAPACYNEVVVMKLPDFMRKPEEHYTPQQWRFGLHNRGLQTSTTVPSTSESEGLKISLAAACNLKSDRRDKVCDKKPDEVSHNRRDEACDNGWSEFCGNVVHNLDEMVLKSYGLHPSNTTNFSKKEVQSLLTLDALTLLLVLSSLPSAPFPQQKLVKDFIRWLETGGLKIKALLKDGVAYHALWNDLFLFENQIPIDLLKNVISKCYLLPKGQNSYSDIFQELSDPQSSLTKELLHKILRNVVRRMCFEIFEKPSSDQNPLSDSIDANYPVGSLEKYAHIFACVYKILTTVHSKEESSTINKSIPDENKTKGVHIFAFVYKILTTFHFKESSTATKSLPDEDKTKESASDREQPPYGTSFGNSPTVLEIRETSPNDSEQPRDSEQLCCRQIRTVKEKNRGEKTLGSATDLKKAGLRIKPVSGMIKAVAFKNGCLSLPILRLQDNTESYFRNLAMYEVHGLHDAKNSHAVSDYLRLMFELIKTQEDVAYLIDDCEVIRNSVVTHQNAFKMWENLQSGIDLYPYSKKYSTQIVIPVNRLRKSTLRRMRTKFYSRFCSEPWLAISVITAFVLLLATLIQTYTSVIGSDKMQPHFPRGG